MDDVTILGLSAPEDVDPYGALLLRALADPGPTNVCVLPHQPPASLPPHTPVGVHDLPPPARAARTLAAEADALLITVPEGEQETPAPLLTLLNWLGWPTATSSLVGKPVMVFTTSAGAPHTAPFAPVEELLFSAGCELVEPRTVVPRAEDTLWEQADGRVAITDPGVAMRALLHIRRTIQKVETYRPPEDGGFRPWL